MYLKWYQTTLQLRMLNSLLLKIVDHMGGRKLKIVSKLAEIQGFPTNLKWLESKILHSECFRMLGLGAEVLSPGIIWFQFQYVSATCWLTPRCGEFLLPTCNFRINLSTAF